MYSRQSIKKEDELLDRFVDAVTEYNATNPKKRLSANKIARRISELAGHYVADVTVRSWLNQIRRPQGTYRKAVSRIIEELSGRGHA